MKILITGISGFVARHFVEYLSTLSEPVEIIGLYNRNYPAFSEDEYPHVKCKFIQQNLLDKQGAKKIISNFRPEYLLHLASHSSVAFSWQKPGELVIENTQIFINLIESIRELSAQCRMLSVGSAEEYGSIEVSNLPVMESYPCVPVSPYGAARVLQNNLVGIYACNFGLNLVHARSFNHIGPYQNESFVIASFVKQISQQRRQGKQEVNLIAGDIDVIRDFTDVRDVVRAYFLLLMKGRTGETYNVCSNKGYKLSDLIDLFVELADTRIKIFANSNNFRPTENKIIIGSYEKLLKETGWQPLIDIRTCLTDLLVYWDNKVATLNA